MDDLYLLENMIKVQNIFSSSFLNNRGAYDELTAAIVNNESNEKLEAIIKKNNNNVDYLVKDFNNLIGQRTQYVMTPLYAAIGCCNFRIADFLLEKGADINLSIRCYITDVDEDDVMKSYHFFKYFDEYVDYSCTLDHELHIKGNILHFLCEYQLLNERNAAYLFSHGYKLDSEVLNDLFGKNSTCNIIIDRNRKNLLRLSRYFNKTPNLDNLYIRENESLLIENRKFFSIINSCKSNTKEENLRICFPERYKNNINTNKGNQFCEKLGCNNKTNLKCPIW
ncbi:hypothetical protein H8356DRAFT_1360278 [Neocallimastix lanati (nom. inval.)]|nr:hypothetical protein H8356DRAFT_1360278 [Neocallimastix sp. JGI-2020a]